MIVKTASCRGKGFKVGFLDFRGNTTTWEADMRRAQQHLQGKGTVDFEPF